MTPTPYERIDALEQLTRHQSLMISQLATGLALLSTQHAALCNALGQSANDLPGEKPIAPPELGRKGRH